MSKINKFAERVWSTAETLSDAVIVRREHYANVPQVPAVDDRTLRYLRLARTEIAAVPRAVGAVGTSYEGHPNLFQIARDAVAGLVRRYAQHRRYRRTLAELAELDDRTLADIGLHRGQIPEIAATVRVYGFETDLATPHAVNGNDRQMAAVRLA